jgi:ApbE superfamily uncharacterized protein (UPF0280 family)
VSAYVRHVSGGRLHLQHGPIDIIARAWGSEAEINAAYHQASTRFLSVLEEIVADLAVLRLPLEGATPLVRGVVPRRMVAAALPFADRFVTPMAAVAGAVADEVLAAMTAGRNLERAYVNDGGDIAIHLTPGHSLKAGIVDDQDHPHIDADAALTADLGVGGLATSGWRGRSLSFGIADAVTAFAANAATADVAATMIAGAVDADDPAIERRPASEVRDDTELGQRPVTVAVGPLSEPSIVTAMNAGVALAKDYRARGLISHAYLALQNRRRVVALNRHSHLAGARS